jgi:Uma2 family endonuclease
LSIEAWPGHLLSLTDWDALPEDSTHRLELFEGNLLVAAKPTPEHQRVMLRLGAELDRQLPDELAAVPDVEVLVEAGFPPTVRAPDVVVVSMARYLQKPARFDAADVLLAAEIISPGTRRTDQVTKAAEYADAGIPRYWIIDLDPPVSLVAHLLVDGSYERDLEAAGTVEVTAPAPLRIDLSALLTRR